MTNNKCQGTILINSPKSNGKSKRSYIKSLGNYTAKKITVKNMKGKITSSMWRIAEPKISMTKISIVSEVDLSHFNGYAN